MSRVVCSHRGASPIRAQSLRRGRRGSGRQGCATFDLVHYFSVDDSHMFLLPPNATGALTTRNALHRIAEDGRTIEGRYEYQAIVPVAYPHPWRNPFSVFIFPLRITFGAKMSIHHSLVRVACTTDVRFIPRARRFVFLSPRSPCLGKDEFIFIDRNSLKIMMKPRREWVGSGTVSSSSCLLTSMTLSSSPGQGRMESGAHAMGEGE